MAYFSRLTDIVACNLAEMIAAEEQPEAAIRQIIREMEDGVTGAKRSVATAYANEARLEGELNESRTQAAYWSAKARHELEQGREDQARFALLRKREQEDLSAALLQQKGAAFATREQLATTLRALEVRLSEARRLATELQRGENPGNLSATSVPVASDTQVSGNPGPIEEIDPGRAAQIEAELAALRRELELGN